MEDLQFWLYVIIGVIYLITQVRKKAKQSQDIPTDRPVSREQTTRTSDWRNESGTPTTAPKPVSFEDLLREITEAKETTTQPAPKTFTYDPHTGEEVDYEEDIRTSETFATSPKYTYKEYDEAKERDYSSLSLEESLKLEDVNMQYGKFSEFEAKKQVNLLDLYTKDLRDPEGLKRAVILTEVLSPRHF